MVGPLQRHLGQAPPSYIDRFLFQKMLGYAMEALEGPGVQIDAILREKVVITCREMPRMAMPVDVAAVHRQAAKKDK